jgi:capsular polysaccharide biosynthesis protein
VQDINLYRLLRFYVKKWAFIALLTIVGGFAGFVYSNYVQVPLYKSDATLLLVSTEERKVSDATLINNYIELIKSRRVLEPVLSKENYGISYEELVGSIEATNQKNTEVIKVSIDARDPQASQELVNGVVSSFRREVKELYDIENITVVDNASLSTKPYNIRTFLFTALTAAAGLSLAIITLFFAYDLSLQKGKTIKAKPAKTKSKQSSSKQSLLNSIVYMLLGAESQSSKPAAKKKSTKPVTTKAKTQKK